MIIDGYIRISQINGREGESFISPSVQREQIESWAKAHGARVAEVFEEFEQSGGRADRPMLLKALARIEAGLTNGLVVATLDRFGRSLLDGLAAIARIQAAGGTFVAVGDGFDITTDTGKLVARIMLSIGEWELDRTRSQWSVARERAVARGVHTGRFAPPGYIRTANRVLVPDLEHAPAIIEVFRRRAAGASLVKLAAYLADSRVPSQGGRWQPTAVRRLLGNRVYLGELRCGSAVNPASHEPLVELHLWQAAQRQETTTPRRTERRPALLAGILRCGGCRFSMAPRTVLGRDQTPRAIYKCNGESASGACASKATVQGTVAEPFLEMIYFALLRDADRRAASDLRLLGLEAALESATAETARFRDSARSLRNLGGDRFAAGLSARASREQRLRLALHAERARRGLIGTASAEQREESWPVMSIAERRSAMAETLGAVFVMRGHGRAEGRIFVCPDREDVDELPSRGRITGQIKAVELATLTLYPYPLRDSAPAWPQQRLEDELARYVEGERRRWPADHEFVRDGRGPLLRQLERTGGEPRWARVLGLDRSRSQRRSYWTDARIRMTLAYLAPEGGPLPRHEDLVTRGYGGLSAAMARRGKAVWAAEVARQKPVQSTVDS